MTFANKNIWILSILIYLSNSFCFAQVYNYTPINHNDFEINPSILAKFDNSNNKIQFNHLNSFSEKNPFLLSSLRISKYFNSGIYGLGLTLNNTIISKNTNYNHIALSAAYRNILFNFMSIRFGVTYKIIKPNSGIQSIDYISITDSASSKDIYNNLNFSLSLASADDKMYVSFGSLNRSLPWTINESPINFPKYWFVNIGNFNDMFFHKFKGNEISLTAYWKNSPFSNKQTFNYLLNLKKRFDYNRNTLLIVGTKLGAIENNSHIAIPNLSIYNVYSRLIFTLSQNLLLNKKDLNPAIQNTTQIQVLYLLDKPRKRKIRKTSNPTF